MTANEEAHILNRLIIGLEGVADAQRESTKTQQELRKGLHELSDVVEKQSVAINNLSDTVSADRQISKAEDQKLNERIDRIARESAWKVVITALKYLGPLFGTIGLGLGWLLTNGPRLLLEWSEAYKAIQP